MHRFLTSLITTLLSVPVFMYFWSKILYLFLNQPFSPLSILVLGDHGPHTYEGFPMADPQSYRDTGLTSKDIMDDIFNVFFAYRLPNSEVHDLSQGMYMNNINVFTTFFPVWQMTTPCLKCGPARNQVTGGSMP